MTVEDKRQNKALAGMVQDKKDNLINEPTFEYRLHRWLDYCAGHLTLKELNDCYLTIK